MASAKTYDQIAWTSLGSAAASITFSSISASWTDLRLVFSVTESAGTGFEVRFNSDSGTNYSSRLLYGNGSTAQSYSVQNTSSIIALPNAVSTTIPETFTFDIFSYANSTYKTCLMSLAQDVNGSGYITTQVGLWRSTSAITSITFIQTGGYTFNAGTTAALYGIKAA